MKAIRYILVLFALTLPLRATYAADSFGGATRLASYRTAQQPEMQMHSTSSLLSPSSVAMPSNIGSRNPRDLRAAQPVVSYKPLYTTSTSRKKFVSSQGFGTAGMTTQTTYNTAVNITRDNWAQSMNAEVNVPIPTPGPHRVGPLPPDPYMVPLGEVPFMLIALMAIAYAFIRLRKKDTLN